jgi:hypothetical protein
MTPGFAGEDYSFLELNEMSDEIFSDDSRFVETVRDISHHRITSENRRFSRS